MHAAAKVVVPVDRVPIYELRERVFNNGHKLMSFPLTAPPAFAFQESFSANSQDTRDGNIPFVHEVLTSDRYYMNVEVIDNLTASKLGNYYPVTNIQTRNNLLLKEVDANVSCSVCVCV